MDAMPTVLVLDDDPAVRHGAFLFHKPEGFDSLIRFLDTLTGRDQSH
jgi:hypothetical protein